MWDTFNKVRSRLTTAECDQVFMEVRGEQEFEETKTHMTEFAAQVESLQGLAITDLDHHFNLFAVMWQNRMKAYGYRFTYQLDSPELFYREFTFGNRVYSLMVAFLDGRTRLEFRFR